MIQPFSSFLEAIADANQLSDSGGGQWLFYPGMLFGSSFKWWGDFTSRATLHEGVDIRFYKDKNGCMTCLDNGSHIPAWDSGSVLNICKDFLGHSIVIEHGTINHRRIISVMAHIYPATGLATGNTVAKNDIIATVADTSKHRPAPHLHVSIMEIPLNISHEKMNWDIFTDPDRILLINPVFI